LGFDAANSLRERREGVLVARRFNGRVLVDPPLSWSNLRQAVISMPNTTPLHISGFPSCKKWVISLFFEAAKIYTVEIFRSVGNFGRNG